MSGLSLERVYQMVRKEFLQVFRDPRMFGLLLIAPVLQLIVFGYAVTTDYRQITVFVVDHDRTSTSRELVQAFTASDYFVVAGASESPAELVAALDHGRAILGIEIPPGFASHLESGKSVELQLLLDGTHSNLATVARGYAESIVNSFGTNSLSRPVSLAVQLDERAWFNPDLNSQVYNVPAVIGAVIMLVCLLLTSLAVVREREVGTLEQLMVSPLRPLELVAGKAIPFALIGLVDLALVTAIALFWFRVPLRGDPLQLLLGSLLYLMACLGLGLLISTVSKTQQEAFMTSFLVFMPILLLSGFMFPIRSMPEPIQWLTLANPLRHYLELVRGIFLKGAGIEALWPQFLALFAMGVGLLWLAASRFEKRAD